MTGQNRIANPFLALLVVVGVVFALTACAYGVMAVHKLDPSRMAESSAQNGWLIDFMDQHGATALGIELAILAAVVVAAIGTDKFWARRAEAGEARRLAEPFNTEDDH